MLPSFALVVVLVVDQLRTDEILRGQEKLNPAGLGLVLNRGIFFDDAHHTNFFTKTCPGHVAISTGSLPGLSGISQNEEWGRSENRKVYCVEDSKNHLLEAPLDEKDVMAGTSASKLMTSTIGDELKFIYHEDSKVVSVAAKDRAAITLAGHVGDGVFWYAPKNKIWTSSTAYAKELPSWLKAFNEKQTSVSESYFPTDKAIEDTTSVSLLAAENLKLGLHKKPDLLLISYSTHDLVAHKKGDDSKELEHTLSVEDQNIARLLLGLQKSLGEKKMLVVLTADHGAGVDSKAARALHIPAGQIEDKTLKDRINSCLKGKARLSAAVSMTLFVEPRANENVEERKKKLEQVKVCFQKQEGVWGAFTRDEILENHIPQVPWLKYLQGSYNPERGADVVGVLKPYWNSDRDDLVSHETPYDYDSWVPLAFWWKDIKPRTLHERVLVTQLAPTLSRLLRTRRPNGATEGVLREILESAEQDH